MYLSTPPKRKLITLVLMMCSIFGVSPSQAETTQCTAITSIPLIISVQGVYCLTQNVSTSAASGTSIDIQTNNVTIDLNSWKIGGQAAGAGTTTTAIGSTNRKNITIKNGTIRGFHTAIDLGGSPSQGHVIEDIRAEQETVFGIKLLGTGNIVRRNQVVDIGASSISDEATGISVTGAGARVLDNDVIGVTSEIAGNATAVLIASGNGSIVNGNRIDSVTVDSVTTGNAVGVSIDSASTNILARDNDITNVTDDAMLYDPSASGKAMDNLESGTGGITLNSASNVGNNDAVNP